MLKSLDMGRQRAYIKICRKAWRPNANGCKIEPYLPQMTNTGINAIVNCYNSKYFNPNAYKKASDYDNKTKAEVLNVRHCSRSFAKYSFYTIYWVWDSNESHTQY